MFDLTKYPELLAQWDGDENTVNPSAIQRKEDKFSWKCNIHESHKWVTSVRQRLLGQDCPYCANKRVCETNSLEKTYPSVAKLWHPSDNGTKLPSEFVYGSAYRAWWQCDNDSSHIWQDKIRSLTIDGKSCPHCKQKDFEQNSSLASVNSALTKEWHPTKNGSSTPTHVSSNSHKKYWWICAKDKRHEWEATVASRNSSNSGCPCCSGKKLCPGNSFAEVYPEISHQWHPTKNKQKPNEVISGSNQKYWWICDLTKDHVWQASCYQRGVRNTGCPFCAGHKVSISNSLESKFPEVAAQWHPSKNGELKPSDVTYGSKKLVWWQCELHHEHIWQAKVNGRTAQGGRGCPMCTRQTSIPEVRILAELQTLFPDTKSREKIHRLEVDVYIPTLKIGVEFDGSYFHKDKIKKDKEKSLKLEKHGVTLVRVRQEPLTAIQPQDVVVKNGELSKQELNVILGAISRVAESNTVNDILNRYQKLNGFIGDELFNKYVSYFPNPFPEETLSAAHPEIAKLWDYEKNFPLTPDNFKPFSQKKAHWKCKKHDDHLWEEKIAITVRHNGGCPFCSFHRVSDLNRLSKLYPDLAEQWHSTLNGKKTPDEFGKGSREVVWWQCKKDHRHVWDASISSRVGQRQGCPFCAGKRVNESNSLAAIKPQIAKEWHPTKNSNLSPENVTCQSSKKVWWLCPNGHEQFQPISSRVKRKNGCPYCSGLKEYSG